MGGDDGGSSTRHRGTRTTTQVVRLASIAVPIALLLQSGKRLRNALSGPKVRRYERITLDIEQVRESIANGEPFRIEVGGRSELAVVEPCPVFDDEFEVVELEDNEVVDHQTVDKVVSYVGCLLGAEESSDVRVTVTEWGLVGYVAIENETWLFEPLQKYQPRADESEHIVYRMSDATVTGECGNEIGLGTATSEGLGGYVGSLQQLFRSNIGVRRSVLPSSDEYETKLDDVRFDGGTVTLGIVLVADPEYLSQSSTFGGVPRRHQMLLNFINGIYGPQTGVRFRLRASVSVMGDSLPSPDPFTLLIQFKNFYKRLGRITANSGLSFLGGDLSRASERNERDVEVAHLTTGKRLGCGLFGGSLFGLADQPGAFGLDEQQASIHFLQHVINMAHEIGHNFDADHGQADIICLQRILAFCFSRGATIMNTGWVGTLLSGALPTLRFSNGTPTRNRNNAGRIRSHLSTRQSRNF